MNIFVVWDFALVMLGLALLWWVGDLIVHYIVEIAEMCNISTFFLGFVVLAIAADIPELAIAFTSAFNGVSQVSVGDLIGANFTDVALIIGSTLLVAGNKIKIGRDDSIKLLRMLLVTAAILICVFALGALNRWHGLALIAIYAAAIAWLWKRRDTGDILHEEVASIQEETTKSKDIVLTTLCGLIIKLALSGAVVMLVSWGTVHYAIHLATALQWPLETVGATILGVGTSLPELALSFGALRRKQYGLAIGPTLGTVLSQTTLVLGILAFFSKSPVQLVGLRGTSLFMFAAFGIIGYGLLREKRMGRCMGALLLLLFAAYIVYEIKFCAVI